MKGYFWRDQNIKELTREELEIAYSKCVDYMFAELEAREKYLSMSNFLHSIK